MTPQILSGPMGPPACSHLEEVESIEEILLRLPQLEIPTYHSFSPGVYVREVVMPAGAFVIGHQHKTKHFNFVLSGRARVMMDGVLQEIVAPCYFESGENVRKILHIEEEMRWATIHATPETDLAKLEELLIVKSTAFIQRQNLRDMQTLKALTEGGSEQ